MTRKKRRKGITPWKKTAFKVCIFWLLAAAGIHIFRIYKASLFDDQREASRWNAETASAQVSAFLPAESALKQEEIRELEYKINTSLAQDSIKLTAEGPDAKLWQDCYSGIGRFTIKAGKKTVDVEAVGTGGAFFTFHPLELSSGSYYRSDSLMKDEILLDQETAWKLFGSFNVTGRTVQVEDMHLQIVGVYKKVEGGLSKEAGLADYVVFVQYKTLLQYGGGTESNTSGQDVPETASIPSISMADPARSLTASDSPTGMGGGDEAEIVTDNGSGTETDDEGAAGDAGNGAGGYQEGGTGAGAGPVTEDSTENAGNNGAAQNAADMENVGTGNTAYRDTGKITCYEIVMPNPVEGYAAAVVLNALGEDSGAVIADNTNRFGTRNLIKDIREFALLGMRTGAVRYPYWENIAMGWETIFAALFLLECLLILFTVLLLIWMLIHWYRHKGWTAASKIRDMQDNVYERQSRKRYPEYYEERDREESADGGSRTGDPHGHQVLDQKNEKGMLEDKGLKPFERIHENRKAVQYETTHQNSERSDGSSAGPDHDGMRRRQQ